MAAKEPNEIQDEHDPAGRVRDAGSGAGEMQLKKRARRRLVGSIALAMLAIVILPLVMDREPAPTTPEIQVRIPNPDSGGLASKGLVAAPAKSIPEKLVAVSEPTQVSASKDTAKPAETSSPGPAVAVTGASKESNDSKDKSVPAKSAENASAGEVEPTVTKSVEAKEPATSATTATTGKWEVQLGAYQSAGNVTLLMGKLKELKVPAYTEKFDTPQGPRTRVRAGPFATKEAALAAQKRVRIIGVEGPVAPVAPSTK